MNRVLNHLLLAAFACGVVLLGFACKKEDTPAAGGASGGADGPVKLVFVPKNTGNPYFDAMTSGFEKAAEELDLDFDTVAPATADPTSQLSIIQDQVQRGVNVLAIAPNSPDALNPALKDAMRRGVVVITVDSDTVGHPDARSANVLTVDPALVGRNQIELMGQLMDYEGKFAILSATTDAPNQNAWIEVMRQTLDSDEKYANMELVEVAYGNDEPQKSQTEANALMSKYPDLKGILSPTTVGIASAAQAVKTAGKAEQVKVTGLGTPNQMRGYIKDGTVEAFQLWSPADEGYLAAYLGHQLATGAIEAAEGTSFAAGELGDRTIESDLVVITGPPVTFDANNIDDFDF